MAVLNQQTGGDSYAFDAWCACSTADIPACLCAGGFHECASHTVANERVIGQREGGIKGTTHAVFGPPAAVPTGFVNLVRADEAMLLKGVQNALGAVQALKLIGCYGSVHRHHAFSLRFPST
jgi:hypothetical protein